jgi:uncharacterized protein
MNFEFDPFKSVRNQKKHGIDFVEAQDLWNDPQRVEIPARTEDENRWLVIGKIGRKYWTAIMTLRGDAVRIISVRSARDEEKEIYES